MDSLGITAVIATILSMIFAAAAMWNSMARRRHEAVMARQQEPEPEKFAFRPPPQAPSATQHPAVSTHPHAPSKKAPPEPAPQTPSLFRQVRPSGDVEENAFPEDEELYVWE